jgi:hypothetical protein
MIKFDLTKPMNHHHNTKMNLIIFLMEYHLNLKNYPYFYTN